MGRIGVVLALGLTLIAAPARPCSVFAAGDGSEALAGNNEDYFGDDETLLWFVPPADGKYGYVAWGYASNHFSQGGMNDQGLFWDGLATPALLIEECTGTTPFSLLTMEYVMQDSATVAEAIENLREYDYSSVLESAQFLFADANGDSAIFEGDLVIYPDGDSQFALNFYWSDPDLGYYPDWREEILAGMLAPDALELTVDYFTAVTDAVHQGTTPGPDVYTRYTTIGDLTRGQFYLYYDLDFDNYLLFDLAEELADGAHEHYMSDLFAPPDDTDDPDAGDASVDPDAGVDAGDEDGDPDCGCNAIGGATHRPLLLELLAAAI